MQKPKIGVYFAPYLLHHSFATQMSGFCAFFDGAGARVQKQLFLLHSFCLMFLPTNPSKLQAIPIPENGAWDSLSLSVYGLTVTMRLQFADTNLLDGRAGPSQLQKTCP